MSISICDLPAAEELTADEAAAVFGGAGAGRMRRIQRRIVRNSIVRLNRLKRGVYAVRYRAMVQNRKQTSSRPNYSGANSFFG